MEECILPLQWLQCRYCVTNVLYRLKKNLLYAFLFQPVDRRRDNDDRSYTGSETLVVKKCFAYENRRHTLQNWKAFTVEERFTY